MPGPPANQMERAVTKFIALSRVATTIAAGIFIASTAHAELPILGNHEQQIEAVGEPVVRDHRTRPTVRDHRTKPKIGFCFGGLFGGTTCY